MKILFSCRSFNNMAGGLERMSIAMMNEMLRRGHEVSLLTWDQCGSEAFYSMHPDITWHRLNMGDSRVRAGVVLRLRRMRAVRALLKGISPDVLIAFQQGAFLLPRVSCVGMQIPMIAAERNSVTLLDHVKKGKWRWLIFQGMRLADAITVQFPQYVNDYPIYLRDRIVSIYNPVFPPNGVANASGRGVKERVLLSVGRLSYQKNMDLLVRAFAMIAEKHQSWRLDIAGEGERRCEIESTIERCGIGERVRLLGAVNDVEPLYTTSHLFCAASRWEGFPNALAEALSHGLPGVGYAGCAGVRDLVIHGRTGLLADGNSDVKSLAETLSLLMADDDLRGRMGYAAMEDMKRYAPEHVFDRWEELFRSLLKSEGMCI